MCDEDVVRKAHQIAGVGHVKERTTQTVTGKRVWTWSVTAIEHAAGLAMTLYPLMGERRQAKIRELLLEWRAAPLKQSRKTHCEHGHELTGYNLILQTEAGRKNPKRRCRECVNRRQREFNSRQAA